MLDLCKFGHHKYFSTGSKLSKLVDKLVQRYFGSIKCFLAQVRTAYLTDGEYFTVCGLYTQTSATGGPIIVAAIIKLPLADSWETAGSCRIHLCVVTNELVFIHEKKQQENVIYFRFLFTLYLYS